MQGYVHACKKPTRCDECWDRAQQAMEALSAQLQQAQEKLERYEDDAHAEAAHAACVSRDVSMQARLAKAIERAEAAEGLALRIHKVCKHTLEGDRSSGWYKMVVFDIGQLTAPAEAPARQKEEHDRQMGEVAMAQSEEPPDPGLA